MRHKNLLDYIMMMFFLLLIILMALPVINAIQELGKPLSSSDMLVNEFERERKRTFQNHK